MTGSGRLVKFGPGTLTLAGANALTAPTSVQSGTLRLAAGGATGTGSINVDPAAKLSVGPGVQVAGPITVFDGAQLSLDEGSRLNGGVNVANPTGTLVVNGSATIVAGSSPTRIGGVFQAGATRGTTTFAGATTFDGSVQYLVRLYQEGSGPTNLLSNSIRFANPAASSFGTSTNPVNVTLDLTNVPGPDSGAPFWAVNHSWLIADAPSSLSALWYNYSFIGYDQGRFSVVADNNITSMTLVYTYAPVPEPSAFLLAGLAAIGAWRLRRRQRAMPGPAD